MAVPIVNLLQTCGSIEHGRRILHAHLADLTAALVTELHAEAARLSAEADPAGAAEFDGWADFARALMTRRELLSHPPQPGEDAETAFRKFADRFDDAFFELCSVIVNSRIRTLESLLQPAAVETPAGIDQARSAAGEASVEANVVFLLAQIAGRADWLAQARLCAGVRLVLVARLERRAGDLPAAEQASGAAEAALKACAEDESVPAKLRAQAEANLAALAEEKVTIRLARAQQHAEAAKDQEMLVRIRRDRASRYRWLGDQAAAVVLLQANIEEFEKEIWRRSSPLMARRCLVGALPDLESMIELCLEAGDDDPSSYERALELVDAAKARPLLRALASVARALGPIPERLLRRREFLLAAMASGCPDLAPEEIERALGDAEAEIEASATRAAAIDLQCHPLSFSEMKAVVPPGAAIISYYVFVSRVIAFVLTGDGLVGPPVVMPITEHRLARYVVELKLAIDIREEFKTFDDMQRSLDTKVEAIWPEMYSRGLHSVLVAPLKDRLRGIRQLWISPHGTLMHAPFHALAGEDGVPLAETIPLAYAPSIAVLARCQRQRRDRRETLFAAGTEAGGQNLRNIGAEISTIAGLWGTGPMPATIRAVLTDAPRADIVHLACHSDRRPPNTAFQGLRLEDGVLTNLQIAAIPFSASLATLSACDTAGGDLQAKTGHEMAGLLGAFLRAGCPSVIGTSWPVDDRMAEALMTALYRHLRLPGTTKAAALAAAQKEVRFGLAEDFRHPYFWAPFSLWGDI